MIIKELLLLDNPRVLKTKEKKRRALGVVTKLKLLAISIRMATRSKEIITKKKNGSSIDSWWTVSEIVHVSTSCHGNFPRIVFAKSAGPGLVLSLWSVVVFCLKGEIC